MPRPRLAKSRFWNSASTTCCSPTAWRRRNMSDATGAKVVTGVLRHDADARPEIVRAISRSNEFGIVEKELTILERLYNLAWVRKVGLLIALALLWEFYARWLDNSLLVPTLSDTFRAWRDGMESMVLPERILASLHVLAIGFTPG